MPYRTRTDPKNEGEAPIKSVRAVATELKNLSSGSVAGYVGETPPSLREPPPVEREQLTPEEEATKKQLREFLANNLNLPTVSVKTPEKQARLILVKKLQAMTLGELRRFWAKGVPEELSDEDKVKIQRRWDDISP